MQSQGGLGSNDDDAHLWRIAHRLATALHEGDPQRIAFLLRSGCISRSAATHPALKGLLPRALHLVTSSLPPTQAYDFCVNARRQYGRTALLLSGGATLGLVHAGVVKVLWHERLLPRIINGSSGGAIIASI